jgi:hypothetical protein
MEINTAFWHLGDGSNRYVSHIKVRGRPKYEVMVYREEFGGGAILDITPERYQDDVENIEFDSVEEAFRCAEQREVEQSKS